MNKCPYRDRLGLIYRFTESDFLFIRVVLWDYVSALFTGQIIGRCVNFKP